MLHVKPKTLYITLSLLMIGLVALVFGVLTLHERARSHALMLKQAEAAAKRIGEEAAATVEAELKPARISVALLATGALGRADTEAERLAALPQMAAALIGNVSLSAVYAGRADGSFVLLRRLGDAATRRRMDAPAEAVFGLQSMERDVRGAARGAYRFYDAALRELLRREQPDYEFDPRLRPWYELARRAVDGGVVQSAPYRFFSTGEPGVTLARAHGAAVVGADVSLQALSDMLGRPQISRSAELLIATESGDMLAEAGRDIGAQLKGARRLPRVVEAASPLMRALWQRRDAEGRLAPVQDFEGREWVSHALPLEGAVQAGAPLVLLTAAPRDELQAYQIESLHRSFYISLGLVLLLLPLMHLLADRVSRPLRHLVRQVEAIERFEFDGPDPPRSLIREVDHLALATTALKHSLRRFLDVSAALGAERDFDKLLDLILRATIAETGASGGALHLLSDDGRQLLPIATRLHDRQVPNADRIWDLDESDSLGAPVRALRTDAPVELELSWHDPALLAAYEPVFSGLGAARLRLLSLPLKSSERETIGTLTLSFPLPVEGHVEPLGPALVSFVRALSVTAAVAIDNQLLLRARKALLEKFIQLVAMAVDARSPYTAGRSQLVPELTRMLAQAACDATEGPYAGFTMDADQWEALFLASWLHDCGKVTMPEHVVDKATKLETLYNRIHEIRTRFEVLKRDVLVEKLEAELGEAGTARARAAAAGPQAELDADYAVVAVSNVGGESLGADALARLHRIGERRWQRTLDDTLGLSADESRHLARPRPALPATEALLQDRPEHVVPRPAGDRLAADDRWGFRLSQPENLQNRGELHNLTVPRGTLTVEERYRIDDHIVQTIRMLHELPFPKHLRSVPEMASAHHKRAAGREHLDVRPDADRSPLARMMAIADVFEALTADDRPQEPAKRLSQALAVMQRMAREQQLDAELFTLFLKAGVCRSYAERFMPADRVDVSDLEAYLP